MSRVNERIVRGALVVLLLFNAVAMISGAIFVVPYMPTQWMLRGPFDDFTIPAIALGLAGVLCIGAAAFVASIPALGALFAIASGFATTLFEIVEVAVVGVALVETPGAPQGWLQPFFFTEGLVIALLGFVLYRFHAPERISALRAAS